MYPNLEDLFYMENSEIRKYFLEVKSLDDLARLLTDIKSNNIGIKSHGISSKQLKHFSSDKLASKRYRTFYIRKKNGSLREINAPSYQLKFILNALNIAFAAVFVPDDVAMGFSSGKSVVDNAKVHIGHNYVFNIDLKDFFPSIPQARVWKRIQLPPFNLPKDVANVVAGICCSYNKELGRNVLPQGAPTSPLLTNAICCNLDRRLKGVAKRFGVHYTRYADDMTFSSMHNVYHEDGEFRKEVLRIIGDQGFTLNDKKTRLLRNGERQEVTGLIVNTKANVTRKYIREIRWILHNWETFGYAKSYALFYPRYKSEKGYIKKGEPVMENVVGGKLNYLKMVKGANNPTYKKLQNRYEALQQIVFIGSEDELESSKNFMYVQPYTLKEFEEYFNTKITLCVNKDGKLVGKCIIMDMEKTLSISRSTQKSLCSFLKDLQTGEVVKSKHLSRCNVILCRSKGKNYWLISDQDHKRAKVLSIQNVKVNIDELLDIWEEKGINHAARQLQWFVENGEKGESIGTFNRFGYRTTRENKNSLDDFKIGNVIKKKQHGDGENQKDGGDSIEDGEVVTAF